MRKPFITFEGGEGTGKSTVARKVKTLLNQKGYDVYLTREPGGQDVPFSESIRKVIMEHDDIDLITELFLFAASRREHLVKKIIPALDKGSIVISDRFKDSTLVYQGMVKQLPLDIIKNVNQITIEKYNPDLVFIFDLDPLIGQERISKGQRATNRFDSESLAFHNKVRQGYLSLVASDPKKYILVDATNSPEQIAIFIAGKIESSV